MATSVPIPSQKSKIKMCSTLTNWYNLHSVTKNFRYGIGEHENMYLLLENSSVLDSIRAYINIAVYRHADLTL
jgi:hypothetical protein